MNSTSVAMICVALIATPAGYAVERLYHESTSANAHPASQPTVSDTPDATPAAIPAWLRLQMRAGDAVKAGRV
jgi:hypothetical protein